MHCSVLCSVKGEFSDGCMHGTGKYTWADGVTYEVISCKSLV